MKARESGMCERKDVRKNRKYIMCFVLLWFLQMAAAFWFCTQKQGFHEDEFYTYYSTARTNGFYVEDGKWMERDEYRSEFVVLPEERFQYGLVKQVQSWDVHPPMYYWVFHTVASLVPGVFSKWIGLSVNLFFHGVNLVLLTYLSYLAGGRDERMPLLVTFVYGFSPAAMSGVVFIRMYEMLTTFVLLCAVLHVRAVQGLQSGTARNKDGGTEVDAWHGNRLSARMLLAMTAVTYIGFLTQYYYFIFLFFLAVSFCIWLLWRDRNIWNCLRYGIFQGLAFALAYLTYPAFPGQMFKGQRGAQATENFFDLSNTIERLGFFLDLMNGYVFGYLLFVILLTAVLLCAAAYRRRKTYRIVYARRGLAVERMRDDRQAGEVDTVFFLLLFAAVGYFLVVSKTALLLGETSNRYQLPVYGIVVLLTFLGVCRLWQWQFWKYAPSGALTGEERKKGSRSVLGRLVPAAVRVVSFLFWLIGDLCLDLVDFAAKHRKGAERAAVIFAVGIVAAANLQADVVFLYPEAAEAVALAGEQAAAGIPVVYIYKPGEEWCIWAVADELMQHDRVYFVSAASEEPITEPVIAEADAVVAYTPLYDDLKDGEAQCMRIPSGNGKLSESHLQHLHKFCNEWYDCSDGGAWHDGGQP